MFPAIWLAAAEVVPPIVLLAPSLISTPSPPFGSDVGFVTLGWYLPDPSLYALKPMMFPSTTFPDAPPWITTPAPVLPEMMLRSAGAVPPTVAFVALDAVEQDADVAASARRPRGVTPMKLPATTSELACHVDRGIREPQETQAHDGVVRPVQGQPVGHSAANSGG